VYLADRRPVKAETGSVSLSRNTGLPGPTPRQPLTTPVNFRRGGAAARVDDVINAGDDGSGNRGDGQAVPDSEGVAADGCPSPIAAVPLRRPALVLAPQVLRRLHRRALIVSCRLAESGRSGLPTT
jgi:hypothetical protein